LVDGLNKPHHLIGGADVAAELDAKRAIDQDTRLAAELKLAQHFSLNRQDRPACLN